MRISIKNDILTLCAETEQDNFILDFHDLEYCGGKSAGVCVREGISNPGRATKDFRLIPRNRKVTKDA